MSRKRGSRSRWRGSARAAGAPARRAPTSGASAACRAPPRARPGRPRRRRRRSPPETRPRDPGEIRSTRVATRRTLTPASAALKARRVASGSAWAVVRAQLGCAPRPSAHNSARRERRSAGGIEGIVGVVLYAAGLVVHARRMRRPSPLARPPNSRILMPPERDSRSQDGRASQPRGENRSRRRPSGGSGRRSPRAESPLPCHPDRGRNAGRRPWKIVLPGVEQADCAPPVA